MTDSNTVIVPASGHSAAQVAPLGDSVIIGRAAIAHALGRSEKTVTRWLRAGILPATKMGPHKNNLLSVRVADLDRLATSCS